MDVQWIKDGLKRPGKNQSGLARALGLNPSAVSRLLAGLRELKAVEVEKINAYLFDKFEQRPSVHFSTNNNLLLKETSPLLGGGAMLRVLGMSGCGADGWSVWGGDTVQFIQRPANLADVPNAYAVFVTDTSMEPRYSEGDLVHIHPAKPATAGCCVLVLRKVVPDDGTTRGIIRRLVKRSGSKVTLAQFNPDRTFDIRADDIVSMHRVVGSSEI